MNPARPVQSSHPPQGGHQAARVPQPTGHSLLSSNVINFTLHCQLQGNRGLIFTLLSCPLQGCEPLTEEPCKERKEVGWKEQVKATGFFISCHSELQISETAAAPKSSDSHCQANWPSNSHLSQLRQISDSTSWMREQLQHRRGILTPRLCTHLLLRPSAPRAVTWQGASRATPAQGQPWQRNQ